MALLDIQRKGPHELQQYEGTPVIELDDGGNAVTVRPLGGPIILSPSLEPWERQPVERDREWIFFKIYRDLPLDIRSLKEAYRQYAEANAAIKFDTTTYRYPPRWYIDTAKAHKWKIRAEAFDRYMDERDIHLMSRQRLEAIKAAAYLGKAMREKALEALIRLRAVIYQEVPQADGTVKLTLVSNLSPNSIIQLAKVGVDLERASLGIGTSRQGGQGINVNVALGIQVQSRVNDDDLMIRASEIIEARKVSVIAAAASIAAASSAAASEVVYAEVIETTADDGDTN